jgi:hypothetical protein
MVVSMIYLPSMTIFLECNIAGINEIDEATLMVLESDASNRGLAETPSLR